MKQVLKYPGSKWNIVSGIDALIPEHHSYVEPFFGSGAVFFTKRPSAIETINDLDSDVTNLYMCIREDSERLSRLVAATPYSREVYEAQFVATNTEQEPYERAASFLIRCWQGHGYRTNGYRVGWKNDVQGRENMYALWNWYRLPEWIKDHAELLSLIVASKAKIMISGYESDMYDKYLADWHKVELTSCAEHHGTRKEILWMNYEKNCQRSLLHDFPEIVP